MSEVKPKWVCQDLQCHCTRIKSSFRIRSRNLTTFITDLCILQSKNNTTILISDFHHVYILLTFYAFCEMNNWKSCFESYSRSVFLVRLSLRVENNIIYFSKRKWKMFPFRASAQTSWIIYHQTCFLKLQISCQSVMILKGKKSTKWWLVCSQSSTIL